MPRFKSPIGDIIEVTEEHAEQVLRPQGRYVELFEKAPKVIKEPTESVPKTVKRKSKKKTMNKGV